MTCLGLKKLKDAVKGASNLISGPGNRVIENAASNLVNTSKKVVAETIKETSKNLQSLTLKYIAVKTGESVTREGLNSLVGLLSNMSMDLVKPHISDSIQSSIKTKFSNYELMNLLRKMYAIEMTKSAQSQKLQSRIDTIISDIINPDSSFMQRQWNSIGDPLLKGILSDEKYLGGVFSMGVRIWGTLQGLKEIYIIINRVFDELLKKLSELDRNSMTMVIVLNLFFR